MDPVEIIQRAIERTVARTEYALGGRLPDDEREALVSEMTVSLTMVLAVEAMRDG